MPSLKVIRCGIVGTSPSGSTDDAWQNWKHRVGQIMDAVSKKDWQTVSQLYALYTEWEPDVHYIESSKPQ